MGIQTVKPTSHSPDFTPSEGARDVRQDSPPGQPTSTPSASAGAALGHLTSLKANRPSGQAGPSQLRIPQTDALAKLASRAAAATGSHAQAVKHATSAATGPISAPQPKRERSPVQAAVPNRMAALEREIGLLKGSQRKAAEHALTVASRDNLRELGTGSVTQIRTHIVTGAFNKLLQGKGTPLDEQMSKHIDAWLHHWVPEQPSGRHETPAEQFTRGLGATAEAIKVAARPEASGNEAATALGSFFHLLSSLECHNFCERQKTGFASHFSICLAANRVSDTALYRLLNGTDRAAADRPADEGGHAQEKKLVEDLINHLKSANTVFEKGEDLHGSVAFHGEVFEGPRLTTAKNQLKQLGEMLGQNQENLEAVLKAVERQLIADLAQ
jgi:hypothetical protein